MFYTFESALYFVLKCLFVLIVIAALFTNPLAGLFLIIASIIFYYKLSYHTHKYNFFKNNAMKSTNSSLPSTVNRIASTSTDGSEYKIVISGSKKIEGMLTKKGATGKGLHEKVSSIESYTPASLVKDIRSVATIRNKLVHEEDFSLSDTELIRFKTDIEYICGEIDSINDKESYHFQVLSCCSCQNTGVPLIVSKSTAPLKAICENCGTTIKSLS
ncbi:hypothetical protein A1QO_19945 [Vibrio genomosp. F10 str. ZF-129]|uniref:DUF4145 domain-containing protein n=1 Tax=Vibrio genomosp. F10 str. ZF-129 TaxID=1187848 RepID=A0A1E5BGM2_9VIBR|nr:hypothetical protein A1QO_19945 [Vibrio genomosp. F10 str. ZF-129]OEE95509.1 hypothetical protein A1QM_17975 [Vibrio genomosp. F10 str. 9ZC157]